MVPWKGEKNDGLARTYRRTESRPLVGGVSTNQVLVGLQSPAGLRTSRHASYVSQERKNPEAAADLRVSFLAVLSAERMMNPKASP